jgi:hypothetical protein
MPQFYYLIDAIALRNNAWVCYRDGRIFARWIVSHREYDRKISASLAGKLSKYFHVSPAVFLPV